MWTIGYTGQSPERLKLHMANQHTFDKTTLQAIGGPAEVKVGTAFMDRGRCLPWAMDTPCIVCEEMCPTSPKAIWLEEATVQGRDGGQVELQRPMIDPAQCTGCGLCENRCPVGEMAAIRVSSVGESRDLDNQMLQTPVSSSPS